MSVHAVYSPFLSFCMICTLAVSASTPVSNKKFRAGDGQPHHRTGPTKLRSGGHGKNKNLNNAFRHGPSYLGLPEACYVWRETGCASTGRTEARQSQTDWAVGQVISCWASSSHGGTNQICTMGRQLRIPPPFHTTCFDAAMAAARYTRGQAQSRVLIRTLTH